MNAAVNRVRGALVIAELEDGTFIVGELPRPRVLTVTVEDDTPDYLDDWIRIAPHAHYLSMHVEASPQGRYTIIPPEAVADWFARRRAEGWTDQQALPSGPLALDSEVQPDDMADWSDDYRAQQIAADEGHGVDSGVQP